MYTWLSFLKQLPYCLKYCLIKALFVGIVGTFQNMRFTLNIVDVADLPLAKLNMSSDL